MSYPQSESALTTSLTSGSPTAPEEVFYEDKANPNTLKQIQRMHEHDDFFGDFFNGKPKALAAELLEEPVIGKNLQYFDKPPGTGQATPAHQDGHYFMLQPCHAVTMWMARSRGRGKWMRALPSGIALGWNASS